MKYRCYDWYGTEKANNLSSLKDAVKEALRLGCEVYDENGEIIFSQWDGWNGDYPDIKKKAFPVADMEMVKKAQNFLKKTSTYEDWYSFKNNQFHEWIGKAEWLHSDRWSAAYDWVEQILREKIQIEKENGGNCHESRSKSKIHY